MVNCFCLKFNKDREEDPFSEKFYKDILKVHVYQSATSKKLKCGLTDFTSDTAHIEVKRWENWKEALGQLLVYGAEMPREELIVYFYGNYPINNKEIAIKHLKDYKITVYDMTIENGIGKRDLVITNMTLGSIVNFIQFPNQSA